MAKVVGHKTEQLDIFKGGYTPDGWAEVEDQQIEIRNFIQGLSRGKAWLPVATIDVDHLNPTKPIPKRADED